MPRLGESMARERLGEMLVRRGRIDDLQLRSALAHQQRWGGQLGRAVVTLGFAEEPAVLELVGEQLGIPFISLEDRMVERDVLALLPEKFMRVRKVLPLARLRETRRGPLLVALANPGDLGALDEVAFATGLQIRPALVAEGDLERAMNRLLGARLGLVVH